MTLPALYVLAAEYRDAANTLAEMDIDEQTLRDTLEGLSGDLETKAANVAAFARSLDATAEAIKKAEAEMAERRKKIEKRAASLREYIKTNMEACGISKIECPWFVLSIRNNPPAVQIEAPDMVPDAYKREIPTPPPEPDKKLIAQALKDGYDIPGCRLTQGTRLEIK